MFSNSAGPLAKGLCLTQAPCSRGLEVNGENQPGLFSTMGRELSIPETQTLGILGRRHVKEEFQK